MQPFKLALLALSVMGVNATLFPRATTMASVTDIYAAPWPTSPVVTADQAYLGLTSIGNSMSVVECGSGSVFRGFSNLTIAACCPKGVNSCNPITQCVSGSVAIRKDGSPTTCPGPCNTGYLFKGPTITDRATSILPGCHDQFTLYRNAHGLVQLGENNSSTSMDSSNSSVPSSAPSSTTTCLGNNCGSDGPSSSKPGIWVFILVGIIGLLIILGLIAYICVLRRRRRRQTLNEGIEKHRQATELNNMQHENNSLAEFDFGGKTELPATHSKIWPNSPAPHSVSPLSRSVPHSPASQTASLHTDNRSLYSITPGHTPQVAVVQPVRYAQRTVTEDFNQPMAVAFSPLELHGTSKPHASELPG